MKLLTLRIAALIACLAVAACAQDLSGTWQGTLHAQAYRRAILKIDKERDGAWAANLFNVDGPDPGSRFPASLVTVDGRSIKIAVDELGGSYEGTVNQDGTLVAGIWTQG